MYGYKAVISDVDGTLTQIIPDALPSATNAGVIKQLIGKNIRFSLASGRPYYLLKYLVQYLGLTDPLITDNGAAIYNTKGQVLWEAVLPHSEAEAIIKLSTGCPLVRASTDRSNPENPTAIPKNEKVRKMSLHDLTPQDAEFFIRKIQSEFKDLAIVKASSYRGPQYTDVYISHAQATKQHAVLKYAEIMGIKTTDIVGIGDGYNDFPLLSACGYKIAMGNAVPDIKAIADLVTDDVDHDGLAAALKRIFHL